MSMSDPIADLLTRIRNAQIVQKENVECPSSKIKQPILDVLKQEGYINGYSVSEDLVKPVVTVDLKYFKGKAVIEDYIEVVDQVCVTMSAMKDYQMGRPVLV